MAKTKNSAAKSGSSVPATENERTELYLAKAAGEDVQIPVNQNTRLERYLKAIVDKISSFVGLPDVTSEDNGKILGVVNGGWDKTNAPVGLPDDPANKLFLFSKLNTWVAGDLGSYFLYYPEEVTPTGAIFMRYTHIDVSAYTTFSQVIAYLQAQSLANNNAVKLSVPSAMSELWGSFRGLLYKVHYGGVLVLSNGTPADDIVFNVIHSPVTLNGIYFVSLGVTWSGSTAVIVELEIGSDYCACFTRPYTVTDIPFPS